MRGGGEGAEDDDHGDDDDDDDENDDDDDHHHHHDDHHDDDHHHHHDKDRIPFELCSVVDDVAVERACSQRIVSAATVRREHRLQIPTPNADTHTKPLATG